MVADSSVDQKLPEVELSGEYFDRTVGNLRSGLVRDVPVKRDIGVFLL